MAGKCYERVCFLVLLYSVVSRSIAYLEDSVVESSKGLNDDLQSLALNRNRREIIPEKSHRNLRVIDNDVGFQNANHAFQPIRNENITKSSNEVEVSVFASAFPASSCRDLQTELARSAADFTNCAVMSARPITLCQDCVSWYNDTLFAYQQLMEASENKTKCKDVFFGKDKLEVAETMYENVISLWSQANCDSCYTTTGDTTDLSVLSNQTLKFFEALRQVTECFNEIQVENDVANSTCIQCKAVYEHLSRMYRRIVKDLTDNQPGLTVCADIADAMNVTHHLWSDQFKCKLFDTDVGYAMFVVTASLGAVPILFYLAAKFLSNTETIFLVLPKRKPFVQDSARLQM